MGAVGSEIGAGAAAAAAAAVSDVAYNAGTWNGVAGVAPSKNAVRDQIESMMASLQPLDADLTAIAAAGTTAYGIALLALADAAALAALTIASTVTLTNKRITRRAPAIVQSATPAINTDVTDVAHIVGLAQAITSMTTNLTGTPVQGDTLRVDITDDGTARAITWGASFENGGIFSLPSTTVLGVRLDVGFFWNTVTSKWRCVAVA